MQINELIILWEDDYTVIATLDMDGEYHEEDYGKHYKKSDVERLASTLELETGLTATFVQVERVKG